MNFINVSALVLFFLVALGWTGVLCSASFNRRARTIAVAGSLASIWLGMSGTFYMSVACTAEACAAPALKLIVKSSLGGAFVLLFFIAAIRVSPWLREGKQE